MAKFRVTYISERVSKNDTQQMLLQPFDSHRVDRDASAKPVWCVWLPTAAVPTYMALLEQAKAEEKIFTVEANLVGITAQPVFTKQDGSKQQDLVIKFAGKVNKSVEADVAVEW